MAVTAKAAVYGWPKTLDYQLQRASATAVINVGDPLIYSGSFVLAAAISAPEEKASAAGLALESNPQYDSFGNVVTASALLYAVGGVFRVSGASGAAAWTLGQAVYPSATGSGVAAPTGKTGIGALWAQAAKQIVATANAASHCGATCRFVDVDERTLGLDPARLDQHLARHRDRPVRAVVAMQ